MPKYVYGPRYVNDYPESPLQVLQGPSVSSMYRWFTAPEPTQ
ncbi:MAG: hypothetical protein OXF06_04500 [Bacteroidetes bacterium]|nr:hypothetical protein [Bacteroidota bacterium]